MKKKIQDVFFFNKNNSYIPMKGEQYKNHNQTDEKHLKMAIPIIWCYMQLQSPNSKGRGGPMS